MEEKHTRAKSLTVAAIVAILFGGLTVITGALALFGNPETRAVFGDAVLFILWFNFLAGFAYMIDGAGLLAKRKWAIWLSAIIALATALMFVLLLVHIVQGGAFESRTIVAMALRTTVWTVITMIAFQQVADVKD